MAGGVTILVATPLVGLTFGLPGDGRIGFLAMGAALGRGARLAADVRAPSRQRRRQRAPAAPSPPWPTEVRVSARAVAGASLAVGGVGWNFSSIGAIADPVGRAYDVGLPAVGLMTAALVASHTLFNIPGGQAVDRFGARRMIVLGLLLAALDERRAAVDALARAGDRQPGSLMGVGTALGFVASIDYVRALGDHLDAGRGPRRRRVDRRRRPRARGRPAARAGARLARAVPDGSRRTLAALVVLRRAVGAGARPAGRARRTATAWPHRQASGATAGSTGSPPCTWRRWG